MALASEAAADDQLARGAQDPERAPSHPELGVVDTCGCLDYEFVAGRRQSRVRVDGNLRACSGQLSAGGERATVIVGGVGGEANVGMVGNIEELVRAEMLVPLL